MSANPDKEQKPVIGISIGDPNGVGMEVIIKTFMDTRMLQVCTPVIYGSSKVISFYRKALNIAEFNYNSVKPSESILHKKINVINCWEEDIKIEPGTIGEIGGKYGFKSLEMATKDLLAGNVEALVTAPINKDLMKQAGFQFPGHTEYLADISGAKDHLMFLVAGKLRVAVVSGHLPLKDVPAYLTVDKILSKIKLMNASLKRDFGIRKPRIAVFGLNPHAGDNGMLGSEEKEIITPAIKKAFDEGIFAYGPYSADGFFGSSSLDQFDAVLAMYHDQGLVPFKALAFDSGVNFTAGLPIVRTSPDHGTAYDIAGKGVASEESFRQSIYVAVDILEQRELYDEITANPLPMGFSKMSRDQ